MKKHIAIIALLAIAAFGFFFAGCGNSETTSNSSDVKQTVAMLMTAYTDSTPDTDANYFVQAYGACNTDISDIGKVALKDTNGTTHDLSKMTGYIIGSNYFVGTSNEDLGEIRDPLSETAQRQYFSEAMDLSEPLNGTYKAVMGDKSKEFTFNLENYMTPLKASDIIFGSGSYNLSINGDTVTLYNQNTSNRKYLCVIYNKKTDSNTYDRIWASSDIRNLDWVDVSSTADFIANDLTAPENGTVRFIIPAGVLTADTSSTTVVVIAFNTAYLDADTSGEIRTMVDARANMRISATVR
ncbi:MAG: hypothetical protein LWY06_06685 [Firmicutes bacterium]|nr:hypothetical protein [Bacillota bacterium]